MQVLGFRKRYTVGVGTKVEGEGEVGCVVNGVTRVVEAGRGGTGESELEVGGVTCALAQAGVEECDGTGASMREGAAAISLRVRTDSKTESMVDANALSTLAA